MKYVYAKLNETNTLTRPLEFISENKMLIYARVRPVVREDDQDFIAFNKETKIAEIAHGLLKLLTYNEYKAILNSQLQAKREILDQEYSRYQKAYYEAKKELKARELPVDEGACVINVVTM